MSATRRLRKRWKKPTTPVKSGFSALQPIILEPMDPGRRSTTTATSWAASFARLLNPRARAGLEAGLDAFLEAIPASRRRSFVVSPDAIHVIGCSGGVDSTLLAALYRRLFERGEMRRSPVLVHLNHRLRLSAYRDECFVEELARWLDLPAYIERRQAREFARRTSGNLEEAGRRLRYRLLYRVCRSLASDGSAVAVTAHHAGDFAETVLMKILRGATDNAFHMPDRLVLPVGRHQLDLLRPLLFLDRPEIEALAQRLQLPFRTDPGNASMEFRRNRMRARVVPLLREEGWKPEKAWTRSNDSPPAFGPAAAGSPSSVPECAGKQGLRMHADISVVRLPLVLFHGATAQELKAVLDRALRRLLCAPVQGDAHHGVLGDILRQSQSGRLEVHGPDFILASSRESLWILRKDCALLKAPHVATDGDPLEWIVRSSGPGPSLRRRFALSEGEEIGLFAPGLQTVDGESVADLLRERDVPVLLRCAIPLVLRGGLVSRICTSWIGEREDFACGGAPSPRNPCESIESVLRDSGRLHDG